MTTKREWIQRIVLGILFFQVMSFAYILIQFFTFQDDQIIRNGWITPAIWMIDILLVPATFLILLPSIITAIRFKGRKCMIECISIILILLVSLSNIALIGYSSNEHIRDDIMNFIKSDGDLTTALFENKAKEYVIDMGTPNYDFCIAFVTREGICGVIGVKNNVWVNRFIVYPEDNLYKNIIMNTTDNRYVDKAPYPKGNKIAHSMRDPQKFSEEESLTLEDVTKLREICRKAWKYFDHPPDSIPRDERLRLPVWGETIINEFNRMETEWKYRNSMPNS